MQSLVTVTVLHNTYCKDVAKYLLNTRDNLAWPTVYRTKDRYVYIVL